MLATRNVLTMVLAEIFEKLQVNIVHHYMLGVVMVEDINSSLLMLT